MAQFTIDIPDELLPALAAEFVLVQGSTTATTAEEYFTTSVVETIRQRAELYKVGPYYVGPVDPQFNADGTLFGVVPDPIDPDAAMLLVPSDSVDDGGVV